MRRKFLARMAEMIPQEEDTVFLTVDIGMWAVQDILRDYPDRAMNAGIFEDGMMGFAAGLAARGFVPVLFGIQPYLVERAFEQIKLDLAYQKRGVNVVGTGAAVDYSKYGYSHYCAEDAGLLKLVPGVEFIAPGTADEFLTLFNQAYRNGNPTFFRISDHPNKESREVTFGKATVIKQGSKAVVIAVSVMLDAVLEALADEDVTILYYTTLAPFDKHCLRSHMESGKILVCEPDYQGTLLEDIYETAQGMPLQIRQAGFPREIFRNYGTYDEKMDAYGLTAEGIREEYKKLAGSAHSSMEVL